MKKNFKQYDENTLFALFSQLRELISEKQNGRQHIVNVCEEIISNSDESVKYWFINIFSKIINETGMYYNCLPKNVRHYYRDAFIEKLNSKFFKHLEDNINDEKILAHLKCLYAAYLQENVYKPKLNVQYYK